MAMLSLHFCRWWPQQYLHLNYWLPNSKTLNDISVNINSDIILIAVDNLRLRFRNDTKLRKPTLTVENSISDPYRCGCHVGVGVNWMCKLTISDQVSVCQHKIVWFLLFVKTNCQTAACCHNVIRETQLTSVLMMMMISVHRLLPSD